MLSEILEAVMQRQKEQETIMRAAGAVVLKQGGRIEIPFSEMDIVTGGLILEVDGDQKVVILRVLSEEEMAIEQAMAESLLQEKH
jgi:hypothetical protein